MYCRRPFMAGAIPFGCGRCLPCRVARRRQWMWRQVLESLSHEENCFVTLTYADDRLPENGYLVPAHLRDWLKRFRLEVASAGRGVRYFAVGEYGEDTWRPHYHLSLFGVGPLYTKSSKGVELTSELVSRTWGKGFVSCYEFNPQTAQYTAGYVTKKMTQVGDPRLDGRPPEFARMSLKPGLGAEAMAVIADQLLKQAQSWERGDVPQFLRMAGRKIYLGRYLRKRLLDAVGFSEDYQKELRDQISYDRSVEVQALFKAAKLDAAGTPRQAFVDSIEQRLRTIEARYALYQKRRGGL